MSKKIKWSLFSVLILNLFFQMLGVFEALQESPQYFDYRESITGFYSKTGAVNFVTGIYLDYRLYDSIFEATILFVVATGVIFMVRRDDEMDDPLRLGLALRNRHHRR